ncbi:serine hydrolase domain-containing protein [Nonomuraea basaltis]|uniref:serine hydrolase domain-containing protein n=1 Tax=Nonomuraea basaltis TaxID=2495887 RepID=UPI00110C50FF|nr:serine hydrolase domain-containing protein [Nonomuraea basaltis]TMR96642.1 beta-lactamase family protein [Nonomuraea basaltis]
MTTSLSAKAGLLVAAVTVAGAALAAPAASASSAPGHAEVQRALDQAVAKSGAPGMVAEVRDRRGRWFGSAGVSDTKTGRKRQQHERFRIGSTTKAFTATVVLQLAADGKLSLDDTVEEWLPGLVTGNGYDGRKITIRQLLNHTSGIFNYGNDKELFAKGVGAAWYKHRYDTYTPEQLVKIGLANPPYFDEPGKGFGYSNTNYYLAAMIVEKATGRTFGDELTRRVLRPLGLASTYLPGSEAKIRGTHPVHYSTLFSTEPNPKIHDVTEMNQSFAWVAGGIVSTTGDLQRFFSALLGGRLLPPAQQREMFTTVATQGGPPWIPNTRYGLGVFSQKLPCGVTVWGNAGATYGSWAYAVGSRDGKHIITSQVNGDWSGLSIFNDVLTAEFCPAKSQESHTRR